MNRDAYALASRVTAFWDQVDRSAGADACHPWTGYVNEDGYGAFFYDGRMIGAHELALTFTTGERRLPELDTCHSRACTTRRCCNSRHLRFDTRLSNVADTVALGRNHRQPRITDEQVRLIRRRREAGAPQDLLAEEFAVSAAYISQIVNGVSRAAAGGPIATTRRYHRRTA